MTSLTKLLMVVLCVLLAGGAALASGGDGKKRQNSQDGVTIVKPGETKTCLGVTVTNTGSAGDVKMTPTDGKHVTMTMDPGVEFDGTGLQSGDTVNLSTGSASNLSGTGGNVNCASSLASVIYCSGPGSNCISIYLPNGSTVDASGGSTVKVTT